MNAPQYITISQTTVDPEFAFYLPVPLPPLVTAICVSMCFIGFCVGAVGNTLVILAIIKNRKLRTSANAFLASLAVADLGTCVLVLPILAIAFKSLDVVTTNQLLCRLFYHLTFTFGPVSIQHLILIAANRYSLINRWYTRIFNRRSISVIIACVWTVNIILNISVAVYSYDTKRFNDKDYCRLEQRHALGVLFWLLTSMYIFLSCFVIIPVFYALTFRTVRKSHIRVTQNSSMQLGVSTVATASMEPMNQAVEPRRLAFEILQTTRSRRQPRKLLSSSEVKLTRVNFLIFLTNVLFLSPMLFSLVLSGGELTHGTFVLILLPIGMNSSTNPLVYCGFNRNFRLAFKSLVKLR